MPACGRRTLRRRPIVSNLRKNGAATFSVAGTRWDGKISLPSRNEMQPKIAILGWGSLLWEGGADFEKQHDAWRLDGPTLRLEFCRISSTRLGALTLVISPQHGAPATVAWCLSKRDRPNDAVADLRRREGCATRHIACLDLAAEGPQAEAVVDVPAWGRALGLDFVIWTSLSDNFQEETKRPFTVAHAVEYVQRLDAAAKVKAAEYVWRAPDFVRTPVRAALQREPWFARGGPA
jgi:hypothetical protein